MSGLQGLVSEPQSKVQNGKSDWGSCSRSRSRYGNVRARQRARGDVGPSTTCIGHRYSHEQEMPADADSIRERFVTKSLVKFSFIRILVDYRQTPAATR